MASSTRCPNCGRSISADYTYCPYCGQKKTSQIVPLREVVGEALQSFFSFDSRFFRSIGPLLFRPGSLTVAYIKGKRRKFVTPLRMYLFTSIIYFSLLSFLYFQEESEPPSMPVEESHFQIHEDGNINMVTHRGSKLDTTSLSDTSNQEPGSSDSVILDLSGHFIKNATPEEILDTIPQEKTVWSRLGVVGAQQLIKLYQQQQAFVRYLVNNFSLTMFFVLPLFALLLKLLYIRRKRLYIEHLVFGLHYHTFCFIVFTIYIGLEFLYPWWVWHLLPLAIFVYLWMAQRKVYGQSIPRFLLKYLLLIWSYGFTLLMAFAVSTVVSFLLF